MTRSPPRVLAPTLAGYRRAWVRPDLVAGLVTGTVVVPQALAYASIAGVPVQVGLYTCMVPMAAYAVLGGARTISVSTTSTVAVLVATTLAGTPGREPGDLVVAAATLTFLVGVLLLAMRVLRMASLVDVVSPATLTGIRFGVGLTVAASQLPALMGLPEGGHGEGFLGQVGHVVGALDRAEPTTLVVGVAALAALVLLMVVAPTVPGPLVVVVGGIALVAFTGIEEARTGEPGLALVGPVATGLPDVSLPVVTDVVRLLPGALAIAVMAFLETVLVARNSRRRTDPEIDVDRELVAVGIASLGGGLTQSLPPAGGFSQSAVNQRAGARTQLSGLVTAGLALLVALVLAPLLAELPRAVLAAVVLTAVAGLLDPRDFLRYARIDRVELRVAVVVALLCVCSGMILGVAVGVGLTLVLVVRAVNEARARPLYARPGGGWTTIARADGGSVVPGTAVVPPGVVLMSLDGSLYTGNARPTREAVLDATRAAGDLVHTTVVECSSVREVTIPLLDTVRSLRDDLAADGVTLVLVGLAPTTRETLDRSRWFRSAAREGMVRETVEAALAAAPSG